MKSGEIWRVPLTGSTFAYARVVLRVSDLGGTEVPPMWPLGFVADAVLVQIAIGEDEVLPAFEPGSVFVNGALLVSHNRLTGKGFERVGHKRARIEEIEFPLWFTVVGGVGGHCDIYLSYGELSYLLPGVEVSYVRQKRRAALARISADQLVANCNNQITYLRSGKAEPPGHSFASSDLRLHNPYPEILREIGLEQSPGPYADEIKKHGWWDRYERAVNA